ncbi:MAG: hypothetical protein EOM59_01825 [Clostridia bacterium]|nr:hypothetical protein [Clostridia bacterium]
MTLQALCKKRTLLQASEILQLEVLSAQLQYISDLTGCDLFIDCMDKDSQYAFVLAEAKPKGGFSLYDKPVLGQVALPENEPAVYSAFQSGMTVRDLKAVTQENKSVKQNVTPIKNSTGKVIGVLVREKDVSRRLLNEKKLKQLSKEKEGRSSPILRQEFDTSLVAMQEMHHRIKNNLQMVASILNLQARKSKDVEMRRAFKENIGRVLSIAAIHDILTNNQMDAVIDVKLLIEKIRRNLQSITESGQSITIDVEGDDLFVDADKGTAIALAVNELMINALEHGFEGRAKGTIRVAIREGNQYSTIEVSDDGTGFDLSKKRAQSLGLDLVSLTVREKLKGTFRLDSSKEGTKALFDFKN